MIVGMPSRIRPQRRYDHRLRDLIRRTRDITVATDLGVPRSTAGGWLAEPATVVVSLDRANLTELEFREEILRLRRRVQKLAALLRLILAVPLVCLPRRLGLRRAILVSRRDDMRSKRIMIGAAVLLLLIGIGQMNDAVAQAIRQVLVVNPPSIPLHTVIQNVPNVNLSPTSNVGIAEGRNTVQVASSATSPLWSLDLDAPQRQQPYNFSFGAPIPAFQSAGDATVAIVQNGQHFVIRHVSVSAGVPIGAKAQARIFAFVNGELIWEHPLVLTAQGDFTVPHTETFVGSQPMEIHVRGVSAGDTEIVMRVLRDGVANDTPAGFVASISGYFVN